MPFEVKVDQSSFATIKVVGEICPETLLGKYGEWLVRVRATENDLPFEQYILDALVAEINKGIENLIWQGDTGNSDPIDGFLTQFAADASVLTESIAAGTNAYEGILQVYRRAVPFTPDIAELVNAGHAEVRLERVL